MNAVGERGLNRECSQTGLADPPPEDRQQRPRRSVVIGVVFGLMAFASLADVLALKYIFSAPA